MPLYGHKLLSCVDCGEDILLPAPESPICKSESPLVCGWKNCGLEFNQLEFMVAHIKSDHIIQARLLFFVCLFVCLFVVVLGCRRDAGVRLSLGRMCPTTEALQGSVHAGYPSEETHGGETTQVSLPTLL